jgi:anti-sigma factor RsiW
MSINRQNYEEYFILYLDNELGSQERRMVEAFVELHPDLKEELDLLVQFKLTPDNTIVFDGKEELMKVNSDSPVTLNNYQEWLLLYTDNELDSKQKATVEQFLSAHPLLNQELVLLQRARLHPEEIIFADKASLYRQEENPDSYRDKPFPVRWWRLAAAAVLLIGVSITTVILVNKKSPAEKELVKTTTPGKTTTPANQVQVPQQPNSPVNEPLLADNNDIATSPVSKQAGNNNTVAMGKNNVVKHQPVINTVTIEKPKEEAVVSASNNKPTNDLPKPLYNPNINKPDAATNAIASIDPKETVKQKEALTNTIVTTQNPRSSDIVYASNTDADFDQPDNKKNKNRGLFRKIARTFEKRTNIDATDDDRLLIAGLSIKLK